jgi:hypothetical protein
MYLQYRDGGRGRGFYGALEEIEEGMEEEVCFVSRFACKYRAYQSHLETAKNRTKRDVAVVVCSSVAQMKAPTPVLFLKK